MTKNLMIYFLLINKICWPKKRSMLSITEYEAGNFSISSSFKKIIYMNCFLNAYNFK